MLPLFPTRKIMKTIKTNTWEEIIFRQVIRYLISIFIHDILPAPQIWIQNACWPHWRPGMPWGLEGWLCRPGCHSPLSSHCQTLLSATAAKKVVHKRRSGEVSNRCHLGNCLSTSVEQYCICVQYYHWEADSRHRSTIPVSCFHELQQWSGIMPPKR